MLDRVLNCCGYSKISAKLLWIIQNIYILCIILINQWFSEHGESKLLCYKVNDLASGEIQLSTAVQATSKITLSACCVLGGHHSMTGGGGGWNF